MRLSILLARDQSLPGRRAGSGARCWRAPANSRSPHVLSTVKVGQDSCPSARSLIDAIDILFQAPVAAASPRRAPAPSPLPPGPAASPPPGSFIATRLDNVVATLG